MSRAEPAGRTDPMPPDPTAPFRAITLPDGDDPVTKGIIDDVEVTDGAVNVRVDVDGLGAGLAERVVEQVRGAALTLPGTEHVRMLPAQGGNETLTIPGVEHVIAVASTKGGVGKTTVAVGLARALADQGLAVGLFDADIYGPNVPHVADVEGPVLSNEQGQPVPVETDGIEVLSPGIVAGTAPTLRRGSIAYGAIENLLAQGDWSDRDVVVIDMPAGTDDIAGAVLEHLPIDGAVFVSTPFEASVDDTSRTIRLFEEHGVNAVGAVMNMTRYRCPCCDETSELFREPRSLDVPVVHELPFDPALQRDPQAELPGDALTEMAETVETYLLEQAGAVAEDAIDLRGLPADSQVRQLADELVWGGPDGTVRAVVEAPDQVLADLRRTAGDALGDVDRRPAGTATELMLTRGDHA